MRIGIDFTAAIQQQAGIGRYTRELTRALTELDTANEYVLFQASRGARVPAETWPNNVRTSSVPLTDRWLVILWQRLRLPIPVELCTGRVHLFHSPDFVLPPVWRARTVLTVHDLSFLTTPETSDPHLLDYLTQAVPRSVARADHILADSQSTKTDLITHLEVESERITVAYPGVDPRFRPLPEPATAAVRARYQLSEPFILSVGTLQPRKNYTTLIKAFDQLGDIGPEITDLELVIAGGQGWLFQGIFDTVERLGLADRVRFLGFVPDEDLPALYNAADVLALPSLYEGFGLPVIEAQACGTPVVTSNVSSLPEAAGDAALLVSPHDVEDLSHALYQALTDPETRESLRQKGLAHARRFTWRRTAETVLRVYEQLGPAR